MNHTKKCKCAYVVWLMVAIDTHNGYFDQDQVKDHCLTI